MGKFVGNGVGYVVGSGAGGRVGSLVGRRVGSLVGRRVGSLVGSRVGRIVGTGVGNTVGRGFGIGVAIGGFVALLWSLVGTATGDGDGGGDDATGTSVCCDPPTVWPCKVLLLFEATIPPAMAPAATISAAITMTARAHIHFSLLHPRLSSSGFASVEVRS